MEKILSDEDVELLKAIRARQNLRLAKRRINMKGGLIKKKSNPKAWPSLLEDVEMLLEIFDKIPCQSLEDSPEGDDEDD